MIAKVVNASTGIFNLQEPSEPGVWSYVESSPIVGADVIEPVPIFRAASVQELAQQRQCFLAK
jgi:hypothetical protein